MWRCFLTSLSLILDWIFSSLSKWVLTFNNQITPISTYLITHQKMSIRLNTFLQCSATNHGTFRLIGLFHSSLSQVYLMAFHQNTIFSLLISPSEVIESFCIFYSDTILKKFWMFLQNSWSRFSYNPYTFYPIGLIGINIIYWCK